MTSEAKIGLLLGLVFIFIIAFIINGLPNFWNKSESAEVAVVTESQDETAGIGVNERKAGEAIERIAPAGVNNSVVVETQGASDVRYISELPKGVTNAAVSAELKPASVMQTSPADLAKQVSTVESAAPVAQRTYVVCSGDSLYTIAKKFYGTAAAGKKSTIDLLFNANRNVLKSADSLTIGQKLVIPQMSDKTAAESVPVNSVKTQAASASPSVVTASNQISQSRDYVVKPGDSLWKIAATQLGNGARHEEIAELNSDVLKGDDNITVGMHLKLPAR